jgi:hypothetical protein
MCCTSTFLESLVAEVKLSLKVAWISKYFVLEEFEYMTICRLLQCKLKKREFSVYNMA